MAANSTRGVQPSGRELRARGRRREVRPATNRTPPGQSAYRNTVQQGVRPMRKQRAARTLRSGSKAFT